MRSCDHAPSHRSDHAPSHLASQVTMSRRFWLRPNIITVYSKVFLSSL